MQEEILKFLNKIPVGKVISYKYLGGCFSIHPRQVARILSLNQNQDIYQCYKVINSSGKIGGYNLGTEAKTIRLRNDGIEIINGKIDKKYFWKSNF